MTWEIAGVAWDIDGTLIDSEPLHRRCLVETCLRYGLDLSSDPPERFLGVHILDVWSALAPALPLLLSQEEWMGGMVDLYCANVREAAPIDGALEVTRMLADAGLHQIAVSNSGRRIVDANLAALGLTELIETSISLDDVSRGKPDPEPYLRGLALLSLPAARVLAVEDSKTGAQSAQSAGLRLAGLHAASEVSGAVALSSLRELPKILGL